VKTLLAAVAAFAVLTSCAAEQANPAPGFPSTPTDAATTSAQATTTTLPPPPPPPPPAVAEVTATVLPKPLPEPVATALPKTAQPPRTRPVPQTSEAAPAPQCDSNYTGACVPIASDVDCAGGSGNGPAYVRGPVRVVGNDHYKLDSDGDGIGCET
jgi:hypothetical protein